MRKKLIIIGIAALALGIGSYYYRNFLLAKQFDYQFQGFDIVTLSGESVTVRIHFLLKNISAFQATFKGLEIKAFVYGTNIGELLKPEETTIPADGSISLSFLATINKNSIKSEAVDVLKAIVLKQNIPVDFVGKMDYSTPIGYFSLPIEYSTTGQNIYALWKQYYGAQVPKT